MPNLNNQVVNATKWSSVTEIAAKLVSPISTMVLARLLTPETFGVLITVTMIISFAEIFTDAGFQKYLIQHKFESTDDLYQSTTVAFWSNFILSLIIWFCIILFAEDIAVIVGNPGRGDVIAVSCFCIPLAAFSSIQMALYKRDLDFKTLFWVRIIGILIPVVITIPLAFSTRSYWSLIIGMIALNFSNAIILTIKSKWKPQLFYDFNLLKRMFSFTIWSIFEAVCIWMTSYVDLFIVGTMLNQHYLGVYRIAMSTVGQIMGLITAATTPILFASLSKLQDNDDALKRMFFSFQKLVGILVIPMGVGIYLFQDIIVSIFLGNQWIEAAHFIGIWGLTSSLTIVMAHYCSEVFRAKGHPKMSVLAQGLHIIVLIPTVLWSVNKGFDFLCNMRALVRLSSILINILILYHFIKISFISMLQNISSSIIATSVMTISVIGLLRLDSRFHMQLFYIFIACCIYTTILLLFPQERKIIINLRKHLKR